MGRKWTLLSLSNQNKFIKVYQNSNDAATAFGIATSTDGIVWTKDSQNPIFTKDDTYNHWTNYLQNPSIIEVNNEYRVYYVGYNWSTYEAKIGVIRKFN